MNTYVSGAATHEVDVEDAEFTSLNQAPTAPTFPALSPKLSKLVQAWLFLTIIFLPLAFGGVHPGIYLPVEMITALIGLAVLVFGYKTFLAAFFDRERRRLSNICLLTLLGVAAYSYIQYLALSATQLPHPVLGTSGQVLDVSSFRDSLQSMIFFILSFVLVRSWLGTDLKKAHKLRGLIFFCGFGISMVALSHWFYDNGKLFWTFEPEHLNISTRARWPFVNPNHLGDFLLPIAFVALGYIQSQFSLLGEKAQSAQGLKDRGVTRIMTNQNFQRQLIWLMFSCIGLLSIVITIAATLSRGTWLGCSVGLILLALLSSSRKSHPIDESHSKHREVRTQLQTEPSTENSEGHTHRRRKRHRRDNDPTQSKLNLDKVGDVVRSFGRPGVIVLSVLLFLFFLQGRGTELLSDRIEYGLMYSKDDLRWQMYSDTLPMISDHLLFGVGLGGWLQSYGSYASPALSGLNPVYLHCDPMQLLSELGLLGTLPLALLIIAVYRSSIRRQGPGSAEIEQRLKFRLCGLTGFLVASLLDFPFRLPAILFSIAVLLSLTVFDIEQRDPN
jgi:hypothetical protein